MFSKGLVLLLLTALLTPTVQGVPKCADLSAEDSSAAGYYAQDGGTSYQVWQETNGAPGLQRNECKDAQGTKIPADTRLAVVPTALALRLPP